MARLQRGEMGLWLEFVGEEHRCPALLVGLDTVHVLDAVWFATR